MSSVTGVMSPSRRTPRLNTEVTSEAVSAPATLRQQLLVAPGERRELELAVQHAPRIPVAAGQHAGQSLHDTLRLLARLYVSLGSTTDVSRTQPSFSSLMVVIITALAARVQLRQRLVLGDPAAEHVVGQHLRPWWL